MYSCFILIQITEIKSFCTNTGESDHAKKLEAENKKLADEIELCKKKLIDLEIKNGKKQVRLLFSKGRIYIQIKM